MVTVLVVDDEPGFRHILAIILQRAGYEILQASDAFEARQIIEAHLPDSKLEPLRMNASKNLGITVKIRPKTAEVSNY